MNRGSKPPGYEYWSKRAGNKWGSQSPGKGVKKTTLRRERAIAKRELFNEVSDNENYTVRSK